MAAEYRLRGMAVERQHGADGAARTGPFPAAVSMREVGPRDGFQNEPEVIATASRSS